MPYTIEHKYTPGIIGLHGRIDIVYDTFLETHIPSHRIPGQRHLIYEELKPECIKWLNENIKGDWTYWFGIKEFGKSAIFINRKKLIPDGRLYFEFEDSKDAILFKLKWV